MKFILIVFCLTAFHSALAQTPSSEIRKTLKHQAGIHYGVDYRMATGQLFLGKFLDGDNIIGLKGGYGRTGGDTQTSAAIQYQRFLGNSFYVAPEIYYFNYSEEGILHDFFNIQDHDRLIAMGAGLRIGNEWQWNFFSIGCDWIGIGHNFAYFRKPKENLDFSDDKITLTVLNLRLAVTF